MFDVQKVSVGEDGSLEFERYCHRGSSVFSTTGPRELAES